VSPIAVLIGPPAAGKSKLGKRVARHLGVEFVDTDKRIVAEHGPIPEIFAVHGEAQFRRWEREQVALALQSGGIVSLGGGAILDEDTQRDLADQRVVLVTASAEAIEHRLDDSSRPLVTGGIDAWRALVAPRMAIYERLADIVVDTSTGTMDSHGEALAATLEELR
jgi:shikimate kinase